MSSMELGWLPLHFFDNMSPHDQFPTAAGEQGIVLSIPTRRQNLFVFRSPVEASCARCWLRRLCFHYFNTVLSGNLDTTSWFRNIIEQISPAEAKTNFTLSTMFWMHRENPSSFSFTAVQGRLSHEKPKMTAFWNGSSKQQYLLMTSYGVRNSFSSGKGITQNENNYV